VDSGASPVLSGALPGLDPFYRPVHLSETGSTNDDVRRLAGEGALEGTLVWADRQTAGRGRRGRRWESPAGNVYLSLLLRPETPLARAGQIGFMAALAVAEATAALLPGRLVVCKWPNDVLVANESEGHRKLAGLLLESEPRRDGTAAWLVLGVGINVASHPEGVEFPATSLRAQGGTAGVPDVLTAFGNHFVGWYRRWRKEGFAPVRDAWLARAAGIGGPVRVRLENGTLDGVFAGLDAEGALLLHRDGEAAPMRVTAGDLFFPAALTGTV
jgi:BirA family biotin operon repressor/biotin-[acetyl-CoA-carboxylase] ligase